MVRRVVGRALCPSKSADRLTEQSAKVTDLRYKPLFVPQRVDRIEFTSSPGRIEAKERADRRSKQKRDDRCRNRHDDLPVSSRRK